MLNKIIPRQKQDSAFAVVDLLEINVIPLLQPAEGPLNTLVLQRINCSHLPHSHLSNWGVGKLAESALCPNIRVNEDIKQYWPE